MGKILVSNVFSLQPGQKHLDILREALPKAEITVAEGAPTKEQMAEAEYILGNPDPALLAHCRKLRLLQLVSSGLNQYTADVMPAGSTIATATGAYGLSISEHMLGMLLSLMRKFPLYEKNQREHVWRSEGTVASVWNSTVLIWGLGDIGGSFARLVKAMGAKTIGVRRAGKDKPDYLDELYDGAAIDQLLPRADVVAMSLPSTPQTRGVLDSRRLGLMKQDAYLLNVGRGDAVDQEALCDALEQGRLAGAGLDVCATEPLPADDRLWTAPNLLLTPHVSGGTHLPETVNRIFRIAAANFASAEKGGPIQNKVDFSTGYRKLGV